MMKIFYSDKIIFFKYKVRWHHNIKHWVRLIYVSLKGKFIHTIRASQSFSQVTESWSTDVEVAAGPGVSTIKYSTDAELQSARNSSRARRHPDGGFLPRDVARESRKSDKPYRRLNARRPSGNKSGNSPPPSSDPPSLQRQYLVPDPRFRYLNVIVREKEWPRVDSGQSIVREFNYRNWPREDEFARDNVVKIPRSAFQKILIISLHCINMWNTKE